MKLDTWLEKTADFFVALGVPAEHSMMAALASIYLAATIFSLVIVVLLLRAKFGRRSADKESVSKESKEQDEFVETKEKAHQKEISSEPSEASSQIQVQHSTTGRETAELEPVNLFQRMCEGLSKTRSSLKGRLDTLFTSKALLDEEFIEDLEEILITADFGMKATQELVQSLAQRMKEVVDYDASQIQMLLTDEICGRLKASDSTWTHPEHGPLVIMVVGVNGVGKTTTIGKLAKQFTDQGKKVVLGAGDTFRAAAAEQLEIWGRRAGADVIRNAEGSDPGAVAFDSVKAAVARKADVLILDTAGRLHTKINLMEELKKIRRIVAREIPGAPHDTLLVLDATTGQNALTQAKMFQEAVEVSSIVLTKLDGTAKGGIVVAISTQLDLPIRFIGIGESVSDLRPFDAQEFVEALFAND